MHSAIASLLYINPLGRLFEFVLGMTTYILWRKVRPHLGSNKLAWTVIEATATILVLWSVRYGTWHLIMLARSSPFPVAEQWLIHTGSCLSVAVLIFCLASGTGYVGRALSLWPLVLLGEASYALYMVHQVLIAGYIKHMDWAFSAPMPIKLAGYLTAALAASIAIHYCIEAPARKLIRMCRPAVLPAG